MSIALAKAEARRRAFAQRKAAHGTGLDAAAQEHLAAHLAAWRGRPLAGYLPIRTEIDPRPVMAEWAGEAPVGVPVIPGPGRPLEFRRWWPGVRMVAGDFGVEIPEKGGAMVPEVLVVPLVAFDGRGTRLGYGGGFYDRTIESLRRAGPVHAVGFAFSAQEIDEVPCEPVDQRLDALVTENGVRLFPGAG